MREEGDKLNSVLETKLSDLDEYSLGHVFMFLTVADLDRCILVCKKFQYIIQRFIFPKKCLSSLVTGSEGGASLSLYAFTHRKRVRLNENWRIGRYEERTYFNHNVMYISQMLVEREWLYMTHGGRLQAHRRTKNQYMIDTKIQWMVGNAGDSDFTALVKQGDRFFGGRMDGKLVIYDHDTRQLYVQPLADSMIKAVDFDGNVYAVTTKDQSTYILHCSLLDRDLLNNYEHELLQLSQVYFQAYETIKLNNNRLAAGKFHCSKKQALQLLDLYSSATIQLNSSSMAVYDVLWKDEHCILSGNFDTTMRLVDTRTGNDEACWTDPYDASVYCLSYNGTHAVCCGMKYHYRVNLYDLRVPKRCVQMYFPSKKHNNYSPVYSIATDYSQLFLVTDRNLRILNFDADWAVVKDYASM
ncbi:F-box/WD repeat-containing protein 4 [Anopheles nili]|uniref:F-box/WD repeat-containing protein 4 n=1 Tax=Anopheles nili TaxID=185578 RepID=UPI00237B5ECB|nr:F-box/WD repeat-containing protein 4 [Anopheles nili]